MPSPDEANRNRVARSTIAVALIAATVVLWGFAQTMTLRERLVLDESQVFSQVQLFVGGEWRLHRWPGEHYPAAATLPGFPVALSTVALVARDSSVGMLRVYCFLFSALFATALYQVLRHLHNRDTAIVRTAQICTLPILFPFLFLMYTDVFSLLMILAAFAAGLRRKYHWAGILALLSLLVRQTNIVFVVFIWAFTLVEAHGFRPGWPAVGRHLREGWQFVVALVAFGAFVLVHGRVGMDNPAAQPLTASVGNLAFSLAMAALLFLPLHATRISQSLQWVRRYPLAVAGLSVVIGLIALTYSPTHPWNFSEGLLRNSALAALTGSTGARLVFAALIAVSVLGCAATAMTRPAAALVYPLWFLQLVPVLLVEPRYYLPSFVLFLALRRPESLAAELTLFGWFAGLSIAVHQGMVTGSFVL